MSMIIIRALGYFVQFLQIMILIRCFMSFMPNNGYNKFSEFVYNVTEPILGPVRDLTVRFVNTGPMDFSPIIAMFLIEFIYKILVKILVGVPF